MFEGKGQSSIDRTSIFSDGTPLRKIGSCKTRLIFRFAQNKITLMVSTRYQFNRRKKLNLSKLVRLLFTLCLEKELDYEFIFS